MGRLVPALGACAMLALAVLAGCGEEDPQENVSATETLGPTSTEGDIEQSPAVLRPSDGYTTLVSTQATTRGSDAALVAAQVVLPESEPELRLKIDGKVEKDTEVTTTGSGSSRVAIVACKCKLPTGEHVIVLEGASSSGEVRVGGRTLVFFDEVSFEGTSGPAIAESAFITKDATVDAEGTLLAETPAGDGSGPALVITSIAAPRSQTGTDNVRVSVEIGGDVANELARTTIPSGKLSAYLDDNGAGEAVTVRGYTTAGEVQVGVASILVCNCDVGR